MRKSRLICDRKNIKFPARFIAYRLHRSAAQPSTMKTLAAFIIIPHLSSYVWRRSWPNCTCRLWSAWTRPVRWVSVSRDPARSRHWSTWLPTEIRRSQPLLNEPDINEVQTIPDTTKFSSNKKEEKAIRHYCINYDRPTLFTMTAFGMSQLTRTKNSNRPKKLKVGFETGSRARSSAFSIAELQLFKSLAIIIRTLSKNITRAFVFWIWHHTTPPLLTLYFWYAMQHTDLTLFPSYTHCITSQVIVYLFRTILSNSDHLLARLLPDKSVARQNYNLRRRPHNLILPPRLTHLIDCNYINRMLYFNSY